jgi:hypothetical protein
MGEKWVGKIEWKKIIDGNRDKLVVSMVREMNW